MTDKKCDWVCVSPGSYDSTYRCKTCGESFTDQIDAGVWGPPRECLKPETIEEIKYELGKALLASAADKHALSLVIKSITEFILLYPEHADTLGSMVIMIMEERITTHQNLMKETYERSTGR